jgi:acyl carrier protein
MQRGRGGSIGVLNNDWNRIAAQSSSRQASILSLLTTRDSDDEGTGSGHDQVRLIDRLSSVPADQHLQFVVNYLQDQLGMVMGLQDGGSSIDSSESIFNLGLDSLMAVELAARVEKNLGVKLELEAFATDPTLDAMAAYILRKSAAQPSSVNETDDLDLGKEAQLPNGWAVDPSPLQLPGDEILLTGASGFLGAYLLEGQLLSWPELRINCIVRASDPEIGMQRIADNMGFYGLWNPDYAERISIIPGDLSVPKFGLDQTSYDSFASRISGIIHNGAYLSQMAAYSQLAPTNVIGTRTILDLARDAGAIPVHMISSVAVFEAEAYRDK